MSEDRMTPKEYYANRSAAGRMIDVETCEIFVDTCNVADPHGVDPNCSEYCIGRVPFVRSAESDGWVCLYDLPEDKARALYDRIKRGNVEPADDFPF